MTEGIQRWRIAFRRVAPALELDPPGIARAWEAALIGAGVPVVLSAAAKAHPRLTFAAGLPPGRVAEHDLLDVVLAERWSLPRLRTSLAGALPAGLGIVELYDVWLGAPSVSAALAATTHRATVTGATSGELAAAAATLLGSASLQRTRAKGAERQVAYDLRPLLHELEVGEGVTGCIVRSVLRTSADGPSGRPDEVVLALGEVIGRELELVELVRERLWTNDEVPTLRK